MAAEAASLASLYRQTVLEHGRQPHNLRAMDEPDHVASTENPLCGDRITLYLRERAGILSDASFEGRGCAISLASASMLTDMVRGLSPAAARELAASVIEALGSGRGGLPGELAALGEVHAYPARIRCATLAWKTLDAALDGAGTPADIA